MSKNQKLYCDNPQCGGEIKDNMLMYNHEEKELYHVGDCTLIAGASKAFKKGVMGFMNIKPLNKKEALKLLSDGKLKQTGLEKKLSE